MKDNAIGGAVVAALVIGGVMFWKETYSGPYRWIAEVQLRDSGSYSEKGTFVLCVVLLVVPLWLVWTLFQARTNRGDPEPFLGPPIVDTFTVFGVVGLALMVVQGLEWRRLRGPIVLEKIDIVDVERGARPRGPLIELDGARLLASSVTTNENGQNPRTYIPVVSDEWRLGTPVAAFIEHWGDEAIRPTPGLLLTRDMPGMVRTHFEQSTTPPRNGALLIETGRTKTVTDVENERSRVGWTAIGGGLMALIVGGRTWRRIRGG